MESVVSKYAAAIVSIARDENKCKEYKKTFASFSSVIFEHPEIAKYLESYFVKDEEKYAFVDELTKTYKSENFTNFIKLLCKKHLIYRFKDVEKEVNKLLNEQLNIDEGYLYSTEELSEKQIKKIEEAIAKRLGHEVELKNLVDPRLIGGVKVVIHDHVFDVSIKYKLETLENTLKERRSN